MKTPFFYSWKYNDLTRQVFLQDYNVVIADQFMICADASLRKDFEIKTGLKINKNVAFAFGWYTADRNDLHYKKGTISRFTQRLCVNNNWNPATVMWTSKSGRIYELHDTDIDCDDIEFWFESLDVALIHRQMFPGDQLPFKLKGLTYELVVTRINIDCSLEMYFKKERLADADVIINEIDGFISECNENSEKKGRKYGVIHNWKTNIEDNKVIYDIDLGSTGPHFFKKLLPYLSGLNCFEKVELC